jgi:serine phosphatase RsbU (regulator of sigma subunit)
VLDQNSRHGTFVNGEKIERRRLTRGDRIEFGVRGDNYVIFDPDKSDTDSSSAREFLSQIQGWKPPQTPSAVQELSTLTLFLEAARKLNTSGVVEEVLITLIETALNLTRAERGYVFLRGSDKGQLVLAVGRNSKGDPLTDDSTISHSILREAATSASEFLVTDGTDIDKLAGRQSIVAQNLRSVICIPLRKAQLHDKTLTVEQQASATLETRGVLYLDSHTLSGKLSQVNHEILRTIAQGAATLLENANLVQAEQANRKMQQELAIAAQIQQRLMLVKIPEVPFAKVEARSLPCTEVGGDFFDVIRTEGSLTVVVADVSGKGISAALLASIIQGMIYSQLLLDTPLADVVTSVNRFLCDRVLGEKYATMMMARIHADGGLEYVNCGHVPPLLISNGTVATPSNSNLPVGLLGDAVYESEYIKLKKDDRWVIVSDGVTEAADKNDDFFGFDRLQASLGDNPEFEEIFSAVTRFCAGTPLNDDCTALELHFTGQ